MLDEFWTEENQRLGAAIQSMLVACVVLREQGYDPVKVCKVIASGKKMKKVTGRNPYKERTNDDDR